jgi:hypothetical protein
MTWLPTLRGALARTRSALRRVLEAVRTSARAPRCPLCANAATTAPHASGVYCDDHEYLYRIAGQQDRRDA